MKLTSKLKENKDFIQLWVYTQKRERAYGIPADTVFSTVSDASLL